MRVMLSNGNFIGTDKFISGSLRTDCIPVPISLEFQVILDEEIDAQLQDDSIVKIGDDYLELVIVKRVVQNTGILRDDKLLTIGAYIALLNGCEKLIKPTARAVFLENTSIGSSLRASGNKLKILEDVPLEKYFCAVGATPTYEIARKCGEEACVIFGSKSGKIVVKRLSQILNAEPKATFDESSIQWVANQAQLDHSIPTYQTLNADGSTVEGELKSGSRTGFYPNLDARRVKNLSTALVTRGTILRTYNPDFMAGDVVAVGKKKYVILTSAHRFDTGNLGKPSVSATKLWLAEVVIK